MSDTQVDGFLSERRQRFWTCPDFADCAGVTPHKIRAEMRAHQMARKLRSAGFTPHKIHVQTLWISGLCPLVFIVLSSPLGLPLSFLSSVFWLDVMLLWYAVSTLRMVSMDFNIVTSWSDSENLPLQVPGRPSNMSALSFATERVSPATRGRILVSLCHVGQHLSGSFAAPFS